jgi:hypothetical protein
MLHQQSSRMNRVVHHSSFMETSRVARSERSPLRIVFAENEPAGARTEGTGDGEMEYRRATIVADDWHGEFGSYDEWARLGPQRDRPGTAIGHRRAVKFRDAAAPGATPRARPRYYAGRAGAPLRSSSWPMPGRKRQRLGRRAPDLGNQTFTLACAPGLELRFSAQHQGASNR